MIAAIYSRKPPLKDTDTVKELIQLLLQNQFQLMIAGPLLEELRKHMPLPESTMAFSSYDDLKDKAECLISLGGDGTLLDTITLVRDSGIPVLGINIGRLGFLAGVGKEEIEEAVLSLANNSFILDKRSLLQLECNKPLFEKAPFALNEVTIHKKDVSSMIRIHTYINGEFLTSYWADGLIVSTPTGSTGYSLAVGGPVMMPSGSSFIIAPIAPHNLNIRPIVIADDSVISFEVEGRTDTFLCTLDARTETIDSSFQIAVRKAPFQLSLVRLHERSFLSTLTKKLNWGLDSRN